MQDNQYPQLRTLYITFSNQVCLGGIYLKSFYQVGVCNKGKTKRYCTALLSFKILLTISLSNFLLMISVPGYRTYESSFRYLQFCRGKKYVLNVPSQQTQPFYKHLLPAKDIVFVKFFRGEIVLNFFLLSFCKCNLLIKFLKE